MALNTLEFNSKLSGELDKVLIQKAETSFLADNAMKAKFVGTRNVLIPDMDTQGLGDYDRDNGFNKGSVTVDQKTYTLTMDRGRSFQLDREDEDETGVANLAGQVLSEFVRTKVAPEVDAYVLSKLATTAITNAHTVTDSSPATKIYSLFMKALNGAQDAAGYDEEFVCFVDPTVWGYMMSTTEITRQITVSDFKKGSMDFKVKSINGTPIIPVTANRMKTAFDFYDGKTDNSGSEGADERPGGFAPASGANSIGLLVLPKKAAMLVKKSERMRTFDPSTNQNADAYLFQYRLYYDLFVRNSYKDTIFVYKY